MGPAIIGVGGTEGCHTNNLLCRWRRRGGHCDNSRFSVFLTPVQVLSCILNQIVCKIT